MRARNARGCALSFWVVPEWGNKRPTGPWASPTTPGRRLDLIQLLVAEVVGWFHKTNQLFCIAQMLWMLPVPRRFWRLLDGDFGIPPGQHAEGDSADK